MKRFAALLPFVCGSLFSQDLESSRAVPDMTLLKDAPRWVEAGVPQDRSALPEMREEAEIKQALEEIPEESTLNSNT